jgi:FAD/FMN-containing dehydrogenase
MKRRDFVRSSLFAAAAALPGARSLYAIAAEAGQIADVPAVTGDGRAISLRGSDITAFAAQLRGPLLLANDRGYDAARHILNRSIDKHPALIVQPTGAADIQSAVNFAREHSLLLAVKCGGHSVSGQSTCDRGMLIDLSNLRGVRVDPQARRAWVEGGTLLGHVDHETMAHGLVTPLGTVSHTGVGGLTLGGGFGRIARRFGLAADNVLSVDLVTADGQLRHASAQENPDLYWAVRGGGGNFGIATMFEFALHPMQREVIGGTMAFPIAQARDVLNFYADYAAAAPDELYLDPVLSFPPGGGPGSIALQACYSGAHERADQVLAPIRKLGTPVRDTIKAIDYVAMQRSGDMTDPRAIGLYLKGGFISQMPHKLVSAICTGFAGQTPPMFSLFFQHCGGATGRVAEHTTAFAHRYALNNMLVMTGWQQGVDDSAERIKQVRQYWATLEPFTQGFYVNDLYPEATPAQVNENYRGNYPRLMTIKSKYDPSNLFRLNANVQPKA